MFAGISLLIILLNIVGFDLSTFAAAAAALDTSVQYFRLCKGKTELAGGNRC